MILIQEVTDLDATIEGEDDEYVKIYVTDNNRAEHDLTIEKSSGNIPYHQCEAYADDPVDRTREQNEYNEQARKFAQYYVFQERGYDTVRPTHKHPLRLYLVWDAINEMSVDEFQTYFGDLYQQLQSHYDEDTERVVHPPADSKDEAYHLYRKEVYLGLDPFDTGVGEDARELAKRYGLDIDSTNVRETPLASLSGEELDAWGAFSQDLVADLGDDEAADLADGYYIDSVSELHMAYLDHDGYEHVTTDLGSDLEPAARFEIPAIETGPIEEFKVVLEYTLICQIRDCFIRMGVTPPEQFQVLGMGTYDALEAYKKTDFYPDYTELQDDGTFMGDLDAKFFGDDSRLGNVRSLLG